MREKQPILSNFYYLTGMIVLINWLRIPTSFNEGLKKKDIWFAEVGTPNLKKNEEDKPLFFIKRKALDN